MGRAPPSSVDKLGVRSVFLNNTYVYNVDVSPPITSALEVALVIFAKNPEIKLIRDLEPSQGAKRSWDWSFTGSWLHIVHAMWGQSVSQWTEKPCLQAVVT